MSSYHDITENKYYPEVAGLIDALVDAGCTLVEVDDGGDEPVPTPDKTSAVESIMSVDESRLWVVTPHMPDGCTSS